MFQNPYALQLVGRYFAMAPALAPPILPASLLAPPPFPLPPIPSIGPIPPPPVPAFGAPLFGTLTYILNIRLVRFLHPAKNYPNFGVRYFKSSDLLKTFKEVHWIKAKQF